MSRIGKMPVALPENVEFRLEGDVITVKGPKGQLTLTIEPEFVEVVKSDGQLQVSRKADTKPAKARHGLYRSLLQNMVEGVTNGFTKAMEIRGVGYRAALQGRNMELSLGYSHLVKFALPDGVEIKFAEKSQTLFTISGIDKQLVGQVAAKIRSFRKPEPYKGKGIRYADEKVVKKAGKSAAKKGA